MAQVKKDPQRILRSLKNDENRKTKGSLKIFFGYAAGVGKTYAMLKAAQEEKEKGIDVVAGYIEPHARPETIALIEGLEVLPKLTVKHNGLELKEFDIDAAIKRKPELILVDELAHTNAAGTRHEKRYQDVEELLNAGIDVYTTINVQHIESLNDIVESITGIAVRERIPDKVFDRADQIEIVDIEPQQLVKRLQTGKIYKEAQAKRAVENFFTIENLTALREIALRRCADQVNNFSEHIGIKSHDNYHTDEHILVCLSSAPSNAKVIRTAARMANAFKGSFTGLFVETPDFQDMSEENMNALRQNMRLAEQLGAKIETVYGEDVPFQIAEFARVAGVSKIVLGRSVAAKGSIIKKNNLTEKLIAHAPDLDIHIIPDSGAKGMPHRPKKSEISKTMAFSISDIIKSLIILFLVTMVSFAFESFGFDEANIIVVYVFGVLLTSIATKYPIYSLTSSIVSVLVFNFFFTVPKFSFRAYDKGYPVTFIIMFFAALLTSSLALKLKKHAKQSSVVAYRTKLLFEVNQFLRQSKDSKEILQVVANQLVKLLQKDIVTYLVTDGKLSDPEVYYSYEKNANEIDFKTSQSERAVANWVRKNNKQAGATTQTLSNSKCLYFPVHVSTNVYGVIGVHMDSQPIEVVEKSMMLSIIGEGAMALENQKNAKEKEEAAILAKNEQLKANLLRGISHDLRTPLTSISGNASNLLTNGDSFDEETKKQLYTDIYDDSMWLINLVENLLSVTRLEENRLNLNITSELIDDVITEALNHVNKKKMEDHPITVEHEDEFLLAQIDARLIVQVIINIVDNAVKYTPAGTNIKIVTKKKDKFAEISIIDDGPGIPDSEKAKVFDRFYTMANKLSDSRRSLGLGLSLCKSIINAHGGEITVSDNKPHGTIFTFTLTRGEVSIHE